MQHEIGAKLVLDTAYVGTRTRKLGESWNYNALAYGSRYDPKNRDTTQNPTLATNGIVINPAAMPDAFLRPIVGLNDITIEQPTNHSTYDSLQVQLTRRFTGSFEMAGSYTLAKGMEHNLNQNNPLPSTMQVRDIQEHVLVVSYMYQIPNLRAAVNNGVVHGVFDNWRIEIGDASDLRHSQLLPDERCLCSLEFARPR